MRNSNPNSTIDGGETPKAPESAEELEAYTKSLMGDGATTPVVETAHRPKNVAYIEEVNTLIKEVTTNEDGKLVFPDGTPESLRYAVAAEKKFRDTQAGFTKSQTSLKEAEAENQALREQLANGSNVPMELSDSDQEKLDELMYSDPKAWRLEVNRLETEHSKKVQKSLSEQMSEVRGKAGAEHELDRRRGVLTSFNEGREVPVTEEVLDNDVPPRITKKLADGHLTFEGYLAEVDAYLSKGKVVANGDTGTGTSLSSGAGSATKPSLAPELEDNAVNYGDMIF